MVLYKQQVCIYVWETNIKYFFLIKHVFLERVIHKMKEHGQDTDATASRYILRHLSGIMKGILTKFGSDEILPWYQMNTKRNTILASQEYYLGILGILPRYQRNITLISKEYYLDIKEILPWYQRNTTQISKEYYLDIKGILPWYQRNTTQISMKYYVDIKEILPK